MKTDPCRDSIITTFVENIIAEGFTVVKSRGGIDVTDVCPNKKCGHSYYYTFTKGEITLKACPHCKQLDFSRQATKADFKEGSTLVDSEGYTFTIMRNYSPGIWEARGGQGQGDKCVYEGEAHIYRLKL